MCVFLLQYVAQLEKRHAIDRVRHSMAARSVSERLMRKSLALCAASSGPGSEAQKQERRYVNTCLVSWLVGF